MISRRKLQLSELNRKTEEEFRKSEKNRIIVVLDNVRSQHNIGSVFRTCDAFLAEAVYLCGICATPPNQEIHKTALGAEKTVNWKYYEHTEEAIKDLTSKGYIPIAIEQTEKSIFLDEIQVDREKSYALIFGNEVKGVQQKIIDLCASTLEIPQFGTKHSFNISVCAGIVLWEFYKQINT
ncbi:MAG: RNA methyltransferase [Bacteroidetes bacterium]|nr:RNA methyltransferase [Bacteroidota bacterium]